MADRPTIGWSNFALKQHEPTSGNSYTVLARLTVETLVAHPDNWNKREPGMGETDLSRKVVVPVHPSGFFCPPRANIVEGMPVQAEIYKRQEHEAPYVRTYVKREDAVEFNALITPVARDVKIVCYSAATLEENDGGRSTDCDWEIVCLLCSDTDGNEPMKPLTMARNYLEMDGGTKTDYSAQEFAESIWHNSIDNTLRVKD
tara:strand:- start:3313 stop:3918 length:606 start_codon:yes stop_codon:yes gene_type:complete